MSDDSDADLCDFCRVGRVTMHSEEISFYQWTDKGYVFCRSAVALRICARCGSKGWDDTTDVVLDEAVQREYVKLP
jgi:hypothetical protein